MKVGGCALVPGLMWVVGCTAAPHADPAQQDDGLLEPGQDSGPAVAEASVDAEPQIPDTGAGDAGSDAGGFQVPEMRPDLFDGPALLSEAGLYSDIALGTLADGVRAYEPLGQLWSDGAAKERWLWLPEGTQIDTSDMDDWVFPEGTRAFKQFSRDGIRIETRMVWKRGQGDWPMVAYLWNPQQTEAYAAPLGAIDAAGTGHDVPDADKCTKCHDGRSDRLLGPSALMLSHDGPGLTLDMLVAEGRLSAPPSAPLRLPGDADTQAALAYLHANCGHCHNPGREEISVYFWQRSDALATLEDTVTYRSLVTDRGSPLWIDAVAKRMANRGGPQQMPPIATELADEAGQALVATLLERLRQDVPPLPAIQPGNGAVATCQDTDAVFQLFETAGCRSSFCHGSNQGDLMFDTPQQLQDVMVGVPATGEACADVGILRVEPGVPERSLLLLKLQPGPPCGKAMPPAHSTITDADRQLVSAWIASCTQ